MTDVEIAAQLPVDVWRYFGNLALSRKCHLTEYRHAAPGLLCSGTSPSWHMLTNLWNSGFGAGADVVAYRERVTVRGAPAGAERRGGDAERALPVVARARRQRRRGAACAGGGGCRRGGAARPRCSAHHQRRSCEVRLAMVPAVMQKHKPDGILGEVLYSGHVSFANRDCQRNCGALGHPSSGTRPSLVPACMSRQQIEVRVILLRTGLSVRSPTRVSTRSG